MTLAGMIDKLIDDLAANLNIATIRGRLLTLREQAEALDSQLHSAQTRLEQLETSRQEEKHEPARQPLEKAADRIVALLFDRTGNGSGIEFIARTLGISKGITDHHINVLEGKGMVRWMGFGVELTPEGTAYAVEVLGEK
jgi:response regulator of citrate/malate metabolism